MFIAGDFNNEFIQESPHTGIFLSIMNSFRLLQTIFENTRVIIQSRSCIDNIFPSFEKFASKVFNSHIFDTFQMIQFIIRKDTGNDLTMI